MINQIKNLKSIEPESDFLARSKSVILASPQKSPYFFTARNTFNHLFKVSFALGLMVLMILAVSGRLVSNTNSFVASVNNRQLNRELSGVDFNIQLAQVKYHKEVNDQVNLALIEIINNGQASP